MESNIKNFIKSTIENLIEHTKDCKKIAELKKRHEDKHHIIPIRYRIFGGLLQSMNIQFGKFIEKLLYEIVKHEKELNVHNYFSKNKILLSYTKDSNTLIDNYITNCQNNSNEKTLLNDFNKLIDNCLKVEQSNYRKNISIEHDIDVLFSNKDNKMFYLEVKYNDDHDTGKYVDINRKFLKSYIGISNILKIYDKNKFKPILFYYLTQKNKKENNYLPEEENIYRGNKLFKEFFTVKYEDLQNVLQNIGNDNEIIKLFDMLYYEIRYKLPLQ